MTALTHTLTPLPHKNTHTFMDKHTHTQTNIDTHTHKLTLIDMLSRASLPTQSGHYDYSGLMYWRKAEPKTMPLTGYCPMPVRGY